MPEALFDRILLAYDGSQRALNAFKIAAAVAKQSNAELHIVSVGEVEAVPQLIADVREQRATAAHRMRRLMISGRAELINANVRYHSHIVTGDPVRQIIRLAVELKVELIVIGARDHSALYERFIGSKTTRIVALAPCPILVVKNSEKRRKRMRSAFNWNGNKQRPESAMSAAH